MAESGRFTGCDLSDLTALCMPWTETDGQLRPEFSKAAAQLSLELAASAYDMKPDGWREAGWQDFSYLVDNSLLTGSGANGGTGHRITEAVSDYLQHLARSRIRRQNPISQLRGTLRQKETSDTCKAMVMIHPAPMGRFVVAIGFMGTGRRIYDWISNFRLENENGAHLGFSQLSKQFMDRCDEISFPDTAKELGLASLTLSDIFARCRRPGSPFRIWMAGHSQGGAVMQLTALNVIRQGLLRQNLIGYSFASPSVLFENPGFDLGSFPLFHIINGDDAAPRVGAALHIGRCQVLLADRAMREKCYLASWQEPAFRALLIKLQSIRCTGDALMWITALLYALADLPDTESITDVGGMLRKILPDKLWLALGGRVDLLLRMIIRRGEKTYQIATGSPIPQKKMQLLRLLFSQMIEAYGPRALVKGASAALSLPHKLRGNDESNGIASYQYIVNQRFDGLQQRIWCGPAPQKALLLPCGNARRRLPGGRFARFSAAKNRRAHR